MQILIQSTGQRKRTAFPIKVHNDVATTYWKQNKEWENKQDALKKIPKTNQSPHLIISVVMRKMKTV